MLRYTELKVSKRQNLREVMPLRKPFTVLVEPSSLCNFRCVQCFQSLKGESHFTRTRGNMPLDRFARVIEQLRAWPGPPLKVLKLSLYGEPLVNRDFCEMVRIAKEAQVAERIETTTNASLLTPEIAKRLVEHQLDYARVSIYATSPEQFKRITAARTAFDCIEENLRALQSIKRRAGSERPFVSCKMMDAYGEENERFLRLYGAVADEAFLDKPHGWISVDGADFIGAFYADGGARAREDLARNGRARVACPMAFTTMAVRSNGDVSPCCVDFIGGTSLGNVDDTPLMELWNGEPWYQFQRMQLEGRKDENSSCARCDIYQSEHYTRDDIDGFPIDKLR